MSDKWVEKASFPRPPRSDENKHLDSVAQLLRRSTRHVHERVEAQLGLLDPELTAQHLLHVIERFFGFWVSNENQLARWSGLHPAEALTLRCADRRRSALFAADLGGLGMEPDAVAAIPRPSPVFRPLDLENVFGWLYVTEGSTLGGAMISRHLSSVHALADLRLECFRPYVEGPGVMWRAFTSALEDFAQGDVRRTGAVVDSAVHTFEALESWLTPLAVSSKA